MKAVVVSASSDIGAALCRDWKEKGWEVCGTYRTHSQQVQELGIDLVHCDLLNPKSMQEASLTLKKPWDVVVLAPGSMEPIGHFLDIDFSTWEQSVHVNLVRPLQLLHAILPYRSKQATVLFFAGGGINNSVECYTSYTLSKVGLIKMCELLSAELPDTRFAIVGPGWIKTKIHESTLKAGVAAGNNYQRTLERLEKEEWASLQDVIDCCNWLISTPCSAVSGRNFSAVFDRWGTEDLEKALEEDSSMYKLRRHQNAWGAR